uniref:ZP domain-containing protein n=1 Tax=Ditylenchus dipsaci TaxID=166011 RepID=A0A915DD28_9BILA
MKFGIVTPPSSIDQLELQLQVVEQVQQQNTSSPFHNNTPQPQSIVEFGQPYQLIGSIQPSSVPFLVHSCWASPADLSTLQQQKILLIDEQGCSVDSHILTELKYLEDRVFATIPCMFQFPKARTVRFECSYAVCEPGAIKCRPDCRRTTSASNGRKETEDEMEMLTELLGSGLGEMKKKNRSHLCHFLITPTKVLAVGKQVWWCM